MPEPARDAQKPSTEPDRAKKSQTLSGLWRHRSLVLFAVFVLFLGAFIGQNLEPTSIDFFFWSLLDVPKVVLLVVGVPVGAIGWELVRRAFR